MKRTLITFILIAITFTVSAGDRRTDKENLRIMSFNAEFLWDGEQPEEGRVNFLHKGSVVLARKHMKRIAYVIKQSDPDVISLVEVENLDALQTMNQMFLPDMGYKAYFVKGKDTFTGQDMALLTRVDPIGGTITRFNHKGVSGGVMKSVSKNFVATFNINGLRLGLVGIHYLSRPSDASRVGKREAQADATAKTVNQLYQSGFYPIVVGDFNDFDSKVLDHKNSRPISNVLEIVKSSGTERKNDDLLNAAQYIPQRDRYTAHWDKNKNGKVDGKKELSSIDHILISKKLSQRIKRAYIAQDHDPAKVSDHFPVVVDLSTH